MSEITSKKHKFRRRFAMVVVILFYGIGMETELQGLHDSGISLILWTTCLLLIGFLFAIDTHLYESNQSK